MNILLKIACQVIARRSTSGEAFEDIIKDYPRMTTEQIGEIREELEINE
jgi:uncharacterized protein (DUF433 family)